MTMCDVEIRSFKRLKQRLQDYDRRLIRVRQFPSGAVHYVVLFDLDVSYTYTTLVEVQLHFDRIRGTRTEVMKALDRLNGKRQGGISR